MTSKFANMIGYSLAGIISAGLVAFVVSCGDDKKEDKPATTTTALKYSDVSTTISTYCATSGCHNAAGAAASGNYDMTSRAKVAAKAATAASRIESTANPMPTAGSTQKTQFDAATTAKANLLAWLKAGAPE